MNLRIVGAAQVNNGTGNADGTGIGYGEGAAGRPWIDQTKHQGLDLGKRCNLKLRPGVRRCDVHQHRHQQNDR